MFFQLLGRAIRRRNRILSQTAARHFLCLALIVSLGTWIGCAGISAGGTTHPVSNQVSTEISPTTASVTSGGSFQFNALVSGTNPSGVTWSTSAGNITPSGLLTAPSVTSPVKITITATSIADNQSRAFAAVNVTIPSPLISTTSLAPATDGMSYNATLEATGGEPPYQWNIAGGALPLGIHLNDSSGALGGTPSVVGESTFVASVVDKDGQTAQKGLFLVVSPAVTLPCGPPSYPCSRSDFEVAIPAAPPQLGSDPRYYGGHSGAGMVATDPAYGNRILRITDGNTDPTNPGMAFGTSWSAEANQISSDESLFFVTNEGNVPCLFQFDRTAFKATFRGCRYNIGVGNLQFGYTPADANAFYNYSGPYLYRFVINPATWVISHDRTFNHGQKHFDPDGPLCLNGKLAEEKQWYVQDTALSSDDSTLIAMMGPEQDVDHYIVVWNASKGCRWMNIRTWEVSQGWDTGLANPVKISWVSGKAPTGLGGVHNVELDRSGVYGVLTINGTSLTSKVFWDIDTNVVNDTCTQCWSHWACDFGVCFWSFGPAGVGSTMRDLSITPLTNMGSIMGHRDLPITPTQPGWGTDEHAAHQNASSVQKNIYLLEFSRDAGAYTVHDLWDDELIGVNWDGSKRTVRFNKTWSSGYGGCPISRLGHFAICTTDYQMYNRDKGFGSGLNQDTCDHNLTYGGRGTNGCRTDILLFELR